MKSLRIDGFSFGSLVVNGKSYTDDLIIYPDGRIEKPWWRNRGHELSLDDFQELIDCRPEIIVIGTGVSGRVIPDKTIEKKLSDLGIEFIAGPNEKAIERFNRLSSGKKVGAGFHLTC